jgi:glycosyltransferase involved in cell wall biosynthesis
MLPQVAPMHRYSILLSPRYQASLINSLPSEVNVIPVPLDAGNLVHRTWLQNTLLPSLITDRDINCVYIGGEAGYFRCPVPHVMLSGNLSLFSAPFGYNKELTKLRLLVYRKSRLPLVRVGMRSADCIAFVSHWMRDMALRKVALPKSKTMVLYHGLDTRFSPRGVKLPIKRKQATSQDTYILTVSAIAPHKGHETLIKAYARASHLCTLPPLVVAGPILDTATLHSIESLIEQEEVQDKIRMLGPVNYETLPEVYRGAVLFVLPTHLESFGLPLLEAMGSGVPVITSDLPICREVCKDAALFSPPGDSIHFADQIRKVSQSPELHREMSKRGLTRSADFSWKDTAIKLVGKLDELVKKKQSFEGTTLPGNKYDV